MALDKRVRELEAARGEGAGKLAELEERLGTLESLIAGAIAYGGAETEAEAAFVAKHGAGAVVVLAGEGA